MYNTGPQYRRGRQCLLLSVGPLMMMLVPTGVSAHRHAYVYLCVPLWVDGVAGHSGALLLPVVWQRREDAVLPRLDGQLKVGVRIEEHAFL